MTSQDSTQAGLVQRLRTFADAKYVRGCEIGRRTECLGQEYKLANGKFGAAEYEAHRLMHENFGAYWAIHEAIKLLEIESHASQQAAVVAAAEGLAVALLKVLSFYPTDAALERAGHGHRYMDEADDAQKDARAALAAYHAMKEKQS